MFKYTRNLCPLIVFFFLRLDVKNISAIMYCEHLKYFQEQFFFSSFTKKKVFYLNGVM